jgi:large subunit ribosomal protein L7A
MDTKKDNQMASGSQLAKLSGRRTVVGAKQLRKALNSGSAKFVFLAENADPAITEPIEALCQLNCVEYAWVRSMTDLGRACGIDVGAAAAAALD